MCNELTISDRWPWNYATIDPDDLERGVRRVHFGRVDDSKIPHKYIQECQHITEKEYIETYMEQILSHETLHFIIYDFFRGQGTDTALDKTKDLDNFDNWALKPISFHSLHRSTNR